jgi:ParB family chromosome partitioning protein
MAAKKRGLGRGLDALLGGDAESDTSTGNDGELRTLKIHAIQPGRYQPRHAMDPERLDELAASIKAQGVIQPVVVREIARDRYELIAGERRWRAAKRAGLPSVPVIVRTVDDTTSLEHALVENLHRQDLNALEEAAAYQQLIEDFNLTHDQVATRVGTSRAAISNTLRLFQLPPSIQKLVAEGQVSAGHARALLGTPDRAFQEQLARRVVSDSLSVREVEDAVRQRNELGSATSGGTGDAATAGSAPRRLRAPGLLELEELFSQHLDTRVQVTMGAKRGKVVIEFAGLEDLERLYRVIAAGQA